MKKHLSLVLLYCLILTAAVGCSTGSATAPGGSVSEEHESSAAPIRLGANTPAPRPSPAAADRHADGDPEAQEDSVADNGGVDVDLTLLSSTMVYAEVYNIMTKPDNYMGKIIKVNGTYAASYNAASERYYHHVLIQDAAACCAQGLEFMWSGKQANSDDYPENKAFIEVVGVFSSYEDLGRSHYYIEVER